MVVARILQEALININVQQARFHPKTKFIPPEPEDIMADRQRLEDQDFLPSSQGNPKAQAMESEPPRAKPLITGPASNLIAKGSRTSKPSESGRNPGLVSPPALRLAFKGPSVPFILVPKGYSRKKTDDSGDEKTYKLVDWGGITYKFLTTPQSTEMNKLANIKSRMRRKTQQILHDLTEKRDY